MVGPGKQEEARLLPQLWEGDEMASQVATVELGARVKSEIGRYPEGKESREGEAAAEWQGSAFPSKACYLQGSSAAAFKGFGHVHVRRSHDTLLSQGCAREQAPGAGRVAGTCLPRAGAE